LTSYGGHRASRFRVFGSDTWGELDPAFAYSGLQMTKASLQDQKLMALIYQAAQTRRTITLPRVSGLDVTCGPATRALK
jgi:hypothetical protein